MTKYTFMGWGLGLATALFLGPYLVGPDDAIRGGALGMAFSIIGMILGDLLGDRLSDHDHDKRNYK